MFPLSRACGARHQSIWRRVDVPFRHKRSTGNGCSFLLTSKELGADFSWFGCCVTFSERKIDWSMARSGEEFFAAVGVSEHLVARAVHLEMFRSRCQHQESEKIVNLQTKSSVRVGLVFALFWGVRACSCQDLGCLFVCPRDLGA